MNPDLTLMAAIFLGCCTCLTLMAAWALMLLRRKALFGTILVLQTDFCHLLENQQIALIFKSRASMLDRGNYWYSIDSRHGRVSLLVDKEIDHELPETIKLMRTRTII